MTAVGASAASGQRFLRMHQTPAVVLTAGLLALIVGGLSSAHSWWSAAVAVVAVGLAAWVLSAALSLGVGMVVLLIITTFINRFTMPVGSFDLRAEQVAAVIAVAAVLGLRYREAPATWLKPTLPEVLLAAWFLIALASSLAFAPSHSHSLKILGLLVISSSALVVPRRLIAAERSDEVMRWLLLAFAVEAGYGLAAWLLHVFGPSLSVSVNRGHVSAYGTLWEPNVFGAIAAAGSVAWLLVGGRYFRRPWIAATICAGAATVSFTRSAWLALAIVVVLILLLPVRRLLEMRSIAVVGVFAAILIGTILVVDHVGDYWPASYVNKRAAGGITANVSDPNDVIGRLDQLKPVFADLKHHLLLGGGVDSLPGRHPNDPSLAHIGNLELYVLNDTGLLGSALFAAFVIAVLAAVWRQRKDPLVIGMSGVVLLIAITNQATETLELMFTWLFLGLLLAMADRPTVPAAPSSAHTGRGSGS